MSYKESDIKHENGTFWVLSDKNAYTILKTGLTHSVSIEAYPKTSDGLSIAIYRCNYLAKRSKT
jgi:hypothetical protein